MHSPTFSFRQHREKSRKLLTPRFFPRHFPRHTRRIFHAAPHTGCEQIYEQRNTLECPLPFRRYDRIRVSKSWIITEKNIRAHAINCYVNDVVNNGDASMLRWNAFSRSLFLHLTIYFDVKSKIREREKEKESIIYCIKERDREKRVNEGEKVSLFYSPILIILYTYCVSRDILFNFISFRFCYIASVVMKTLENRKIINDHYLTDLSPLDAIKSNLTRESNRTSQLTRRNKGWRI